MSKAAFPLHDMVSQNVRVCRTAGSLPWERLGQWGGVTFSCMSVVNTHRHLFQGIDPGGVCWVTHHTHVRLQGTLPVVGS